MEIIEPTVVSWLQHDNITHIARCARVCYDSKSNNFDKKLVSNLWKNNHRSMFRHAGVYYIIPEKINIAYQAYISSTIKTIGNVNYVSTNEQCAIEYWDNLYKDYRISIYKAESNEVFIKYKMLRYTLCIETGIDITREFNRKSPNNIAEQSTRFIDFTKRKNIKFKKCHWMSKCSFYKKLIYKFMLKTTEIFYRIARSKYGLNLKPEDARFILPLDTMSKVIYTYTIKEWEDILNLRLYDATGKAHPDAKIIGELIKEELYKLGHNIVSVNKK